jgi:hypothetical protein
VGGGCAIEVIYLTDRWWARKKFALRGIFSGSSKGRKGLLFLKKKKQKDFSPFEAEPP